MIDGFFNHAQSARAKQWQDAIKQFTSLDAGLIGGGKDSEGDQFTIGLIQTLCKRDLSLLSYGLVIADECHNIPAQQAYAVSDGYQCQVQIWPISNAATTR